MCLQQNLNAGLLMKITKTDLAAVIAKGGLGAIPGVGALAAEVVGMLIPNQRLDRIERLLEDLAKQLSEQNPEDVRQSFTRAEFVDLLEDGMIQSSRALSDERIHRLAILLRGSLTDVEVNHLRDKRLLELLGQLNDAELVLLQSYTVKSRHDQEFQDLHRDVLTAPPAYMGAPQDQLDNSTLHQQFNEHLVQLGLLDQKLRFDRETGLPEFDKRTGKPKISYKELSSLGRLLLKRVDLLGEGEL